jgi:hypothetical protein
MKLIGYILVGILFSIYTSGWWLCILFNEAAEKTMERGLWSIGLVTVIIGSSVLGSLLAFALARNWIAIWGLEEKTSTE